MASPTFKGRNLANDLMTLHRYLLAPPAKGWKTSGTFTMTHDNPISAKDLDELIFRKLNYRLGIDKKNPDKLRDWLNDKVAEQAKKVGENIIGDEPFGLVMKVAGLWLDGMKWLTFQGHLSIPPYPNASPYNPDTDPDIYIEFMIYCWRYGEFRYKSPWKEGW